MTLKISYYDDKTQFARQLEAAIEKGLQSSKHSSVKPQKLDRQALVDWMNSLLAGHKETPASRSLQKQFDACDILFLDADLRDTEGLPFLTGERVAYAVRCYTECRSIVMVNPTPRPTFDLRLCAVPQESWADAWLHVKDIGNPWLWSEQRTGFAPWYWPNLATIPAKVEARNKEARLVTKLRTLLSVPPEVEKRIPKDRFTPAVGSLDDTLAKIVDRRIRSDDKAIGTPARQRIAAFIVAGWVDNRLLPGEDVLIDAPHACTRFPGLMADDPDAVCQRQLTKFPGAAAMKEHAFGKDHWTTRSTWWLTLLENDARLASFGQARTDLVFAEDASRFVKHTSKVESFTMAIATPLLERYISYYKPEGNRDYEPAVRLLGA